MEKQIVLISCASKKLPHKAKAKEIYTSTLFSLNLKYAEILSPDKIFILSAKYGLLALEEEVETYDITLNDMKSDELKIWAKKVIQQLKECCDLNQTKFIILAGKKYRKHLLPYFCVYTIPLIGLGIGQQLQKLKSLTS